MHKFESGYHGGGEIDEIEWKTIVLAHSAHSAWLEVIRDQFSMIVRICAIF